MIFSYTKDRIISSSQEKKQKKPKKSKKFSCHIKSITHKTILKIVSVVVHRGERKKKIKNFGKSVSIINPSHILLS